MRSFIEQHFDDCRRTGRTSRLLADACAQARAGKRVLVVAATEVNARFMRRQYLTQHGGYIDPVDANLIHPRKQGPGWVCFAAAGAVTIDWARARLPFNPGVELLLDHFAIETYLLQHSPLLAMWQKYQGAGDQPWQSVEWKGIDRDS